MTEKSKLLQQCGNKISKTELLAALSEECIELAHAALKYRRSITQDNPTPTSEDESWRIVKEEISDVMNILVSGHFVHPEATIESICSEEKAIRWMKRLNSRVYEAHRNPYINKEKTEKKAWEYSREYWDRMKQGESNI